VSAGRANRAGSVAPQGMDGTVRARMREVRRGRLLAAVVEVVSEVGYSGMSMARVTSRAGVSRGTFYDFFEDSEDCFLAAFDVAAARVAVVAGLAFEREGCWGEKVRAGLSALLVFVGDQRGLGSLLVVEALSAGPRVLERRAQWLVTLAGIVDQGRAEAKPGREPPPLTAEGVVGAVLSVLHARLLERDGSLVELLNPLMATIVLPYLGPAAARKELVRPTPRARRVAQKPTRNPLDELDMRITYRTLRVLAAVAIAPGGSNREVADRAGVSDQGQISKLLVRLAKLGLIENDRRVKGERNDWRLTPKGDEVRRAIDLQAARVEG
jgi:AcrR family transcriptional regulator